MQCLRTVIAELFWTGLLPANLANGGCEWARSGLSLRKISISAGERLNRYRTASACASLCPRRVARSLPTASDLAVGRKLLSAGAVGAGAGIAGALRVAAGAGGGSLVGAAAAVGAGAWVAGALRIRAATFVSLNGHDYSFQFGSSKLPRDFRKYVELSQIINSNESRFRL